MKTETPIRVWRRRVKGWRMPENTVSVCRPGRWGNPFKIGEYFRIGDTNPRALFQFSYMRRIIWKPADIEDALSTGFKLIETQEQAVEMFERWMKSSPWNLSPLRGKNLACFCKPGTACHADTLLRLANQ